MAATPREPRAEPEEGGEERRAFLLRLPPALLDEVRAWAAQELRSLNGHIEWILREAVRRRRREKA